MSQAVSGSGKKDAAEFLGSLPTPYQQVDALAQIREALAERNQCVAVIDDDPTGTQTVRDVPVLTQWSEEDLRAAVKDPARVFFVLTNSRSLPEAEAAAVNEELGELLARVAAETGVDVRIISRSDSTLRGYFPVETNALERGWRSGGGSPIDGVILCPAFPEAGRIVVSGDLWVKEGQQLTHAAQTEFAQDPAFGYSNSNLLAWASEKLGDREPGTGSMVDVSIEDIRQGGPERVTQLLGDLGPNSIVAVNAVNYADLEVFVLGLLAAEEAGKRFLYRTGPSFVSARSANEDGRPLSREEIYEGKEATDGNGLTVVGSYTRLTTGQLDNAVRALDLEYVQLDTNALLDDRREEELSRARDLVELSLKRGDVLVATSRESIVAKDPEASLEQGRSISDALVELVRGLDPVLPLRYLVAKGGITSHDLASRGLDASKARVVGQMQEGMISLWRLDKDSRRPGLPFVVFPGNVGDEDTLANVLKVLRGDSSA